MTPLLLLFPTIKILLCEPLLGTKPNALLLSPSLSPCLPFTCLPSFLPFLPSIMLISAAWRLGRSKGRLWGS